MRQRTVKQIRAEALRLSGRLANHTGARKLLSGQVTREEYAGFLIQMYHYIRWGARLLRAASRRLRAQGQHPDLADIMELQADQESEHEQWVLSDLLELGCSESSVHATPPAGAVKAYVAWNCFMVLDGAPVALLGTTHVLRLLAILHAGRVAGALVGAGAIPGIQNAVKLLSGHARVDPQNVEMIEHAICLVTEPEECEAILDSAHTARVQFAGLFAGLAAPGAVPDSAHAFPLPRPWAAALTARQRQVTAGVLKGEQNRDIADDLGCSIATVKKHLQNVFDKLGVDHRMDLFSRYFWQMFDDWMLLAE